MKLNSGNARITQVRAEMLQETTLGQKLKLKPKQQIRNPGREEILSLLFGYSAAYVHKKEIPLSLITHFIFSQSNNDLQP